jgi:hypothetical protein
MRSAVKNASDTYPSPCYGIDIADDGAVVVAEQVNGQPATASRYAAGDPGVLAISEHIARRSPRPRICIRSCGAAAFAVALGLAALPGGEIMLVAPAAMQSAARASREPTATPEERARQLARLAGHLY